MGAYHTTLGALENAHFEYGTKDAYDVGEDGEWRHFRVPASEYEEFMDYNSNKNTEPPAEESEPQIEEAALSAENAEPSSIDDGG